MKNHLVSTAIALTMSVSIIHQANARCWRELNGEVNCDTQEENQKIYDGLRENAERNQAITEEKNKNWKFNSAQRIGGSRAGKETVRTNTKWGAHSEPTGVPVAPGKIDHTRSTSTRDADIKDLYKRFGGSIPWK